MPTPMNGYQEENFAGISLVNDPEGERAWLLRIKYIQDRFTDNGALLTDCIFAGSTRDIYELPGPSSLAPIEAAFKIAKKNRDTLMLFELEQVLGRIGRLYTPPSSSTCFSDNWQYNQAVAAYNANFDETEKLVQYLSHHESPAMRYVGIALMAVAVVMVLACILFASIPTFGGALGLALAATVGVAIAGGAVGVGLGIGGAVVFSKDKHTGVPKAVSDLLGKHKRLEPLDLPSLPGDEDHNDRDRVFDLIAILSNQLCDTYRLPLLDHSEIGIFKSALIDAMKMNSHNKLFAENDEYLVIEQELNEVMEKYTETQDRFYLFESLADISGLRLLKLKIENPNTIQSGIHDAQIWRHVSNNPRVHASDNARFLEVDKKIGNDVYRFVLVDHPEPDTLLRSPKRSTGEPTLTEAYMHAVRTGHPDNQSWVKNTAGFFHSTSVGVMSRGARAASAAMSASAGAGAGHAYASSPAASGVSGAAGAWGSASGVSFSASHAMNANDSYLTDGDFEDDDSVSNHEPFSAATCIGIAASRRGGKSVSLASDELHMGVHQYGIDMGDEDDNSEFVPCPNSSTAGIGVGVRGLLAGSALRAMDDSEGADEDNTQRIFRR